MIELPQAARFSKEKVLFRLSFRQRGGFFAASVLIILTAVGALGQTYNTYQNHLRNQNGVRQEIARLDITIEREGGVPLPIKMVPRTRAGDIIRVRMLDQPINGILPDQSQWDWTFVVAFANPSRNKNSPEAVSREVNFRRDGWYREHAFKVPYDSQPIFFLYPRQNYRKKIRKLINRNANDLRKIGEKTLEISGAYAKIGMFLNQLQDVIRQNPSVYQNNNGYNSYGNYGGYYGYGTLPQSNFMKEQFVERLAQSFNIALPNCWKNSYNNRNNGLNYGYNPGAYGANDFTSRAQCVAQNVKLEDFDLSVSKILTQGGLLAATDLAKKYPELAHWINIAAVAADLILRLTRKTPLKILPTMSFSGNNASNYAGGNNYNQYNYPRSNYNQNNYTQNNYNRSGPARTSAVIPSQPISIVADTSPTDSNYVSAYPIVLHKWQAQPDPEVISLPVPTLLEKCLHLGRNILKNTDLAYDWLRDPFARDFKLVLSSDNGFTKEFPLIKNMGMSGWDMHLNPQDIAAFPKVKMTLTGEVVATRGFSKIKSKKFAIPIPGGGNWAVSKESKGDFSVGGKRRVSIVNKEGNCLCLRAVRYKPDFGGEFNFAVGAAANAIRISDDGSYAWFEMNTAEFKPGKGKLEVYSHGTVQPQIIPLQLYGSAPKIKEIVVHKGDKYLFIEGSGIEQVNKLIVNGKPAPHDGELQLWYPRNRKIFVFQNAQDLVLANTVSVEMELEGGRHYKYPGTFKVRKARPVIASGEKGEIEADVLGGAAVKSRNRFDLSAYPIVPVDIAKMTVAVRTSLTDYNLRAENISIETRIENGRVGIKELPRAKFEVIDTFNMRIDFDFDVEHQQFLAGRRLQFRINDRLRGTSDWYTIKQTFVRFPKVNSVSCAAGKCRITGKGLDYIGPYSTDGGTTWKPPLQAKATPKGGHVLIIPDAKRRSLIRVKLRDFSKTEGYRLVR
ncbi:MAG: hypothetical protein HKN25_17790 [Pyrinomonadaceae bacterium]|nr:hypothetical protein [Pyrinomonadaceae bacterium]